MSIHFPQYRKYKNNKSFFKITSESSFEEIKFLPGGEVKYHCFEAKILPDRNFICDLLNDVGLYVDMITEKEFEEKKSRID